jgi:hypothetical protein
MTVVVGAGVRLGWGSLIGPTYTITYNNITTESDEWLTTETDNPLITEN